jgi:hypothetical protein
MKKTTGIDRKMRTAIYRSSLAPASRAVALAICEFAGFTDGADIYPSVDLLADMTGYSHPTITKHTKLLIDEQVFFRVDVRGVDPELLPKSCNKSRGYLYCMNPSWYKQVMGNELYLNELYLNLFKVNEVGVTKPSPKQDKNQTEQESSQPARAHTHEGGSHEQSKSKSVRPVADDTRGHSRGDDPHGSAHPLPDVHPGADARGSDAPSSTHRAEDEGRLTPDRRYRIAYDLAQFVLAANEDRPVGQQLGASFTMLEPAMLSFVKHVEARVSSERVEDVAGQCIRAVVHAERLKFLEMWAREALDDVLAEKAPAVSRAPRRAPSSSRLPQPGSSFEEEDDWSAKYKRAFDLAKEAQQ